MEGGERRQWKVEVRGRGGGDAGWFKFKAGKGK